jgi:Domain of unknown function (DUF4375)
MACLRTSLSFRDKRVASPKTRLILFALLSVSPGCDRSQAPDQAPQFAFQHPAAKEVKRLFLTLDVQSEADYRQLPRRDRYLWDVSRFEAEVMNGGVNQYFFNPAGDHAAGCLEALTGIGAKRSHGLLKHACDLFPAGRPSADRSVRQQQLLAMSGGKHVDDLISGEIEVDLYQHMLNYYKSADPKGK